MKLRIVQQVDENIGVAEFPSHPGQPVKVYLPGNKLAKRGYALAERPPWAADPSKLTSSERSAMGRKGAMVVAQRAAERRLVSLEALGEALTMHPDSKTVKDGLRMLWAARQEQANNADGGGGAVRAHELIERVWSGDPEGKSVPAVQVNVVLKAETVAEMERLEQLVVEAVVVEKQETEQAAGDS